MRDGIVLGVEDLAGKAIQNKHDDKAALTCVRGRIDTFHPRSGAGRGPEDRLRRQRAATDKSPERELDEAGLLFRQ